MTSVPGWYSSRVKREGKLASALSRVVYDWCTMKTCVDYLGKRAACILVFGGLRCFCQGWVRRPKLWQTHLGLRQLWGWCGWSSRSSWVRLGCHKHLQAVDKAC